MRLLTGPSLPNLSRSVIALGMFDGCHNGHKRVLREAASQARHAGCPLVVWTYDRHPLALVAPERAPRALQSLSQRMASLCEAGADIVCLRPFTREEADIEPEAFVRTLVHQLGMRAVLLGRSNTFGRQARGTPVLLEGQGRALGFDTRVVDTVRLGDEKVTSSAIRIHLARGEMRRASAMLGRLYSLEGGVVSGKQLGREMGFPTINVAMRGERHLPRFGVYAGWADIAGGHWPCVLNLGNRPTVGGGAVSLEAHLLGFEGDLYGEKATVRFFAFLRPERKFGSLRELQGAIERDQTKARSVLL